MRDQSENPVVANELLDIHGLRTEFATERGIVKAVDGISFSVRRETTIGLVGESGCGKSVTAHSILQILTPPGRIVGGKILYYRPDSASPVDLARLDPKSREMRSIRGSAISIIFQEPMTCLSPVHTVGNQIIESVRVHEKGISRSQARDRAIELLRMVGMPSPETRIDAYSFELSGGMRQRAMIAVGISAGPELLIADEPTTAVDVTIQAKVLALLKQLQRETSMSVLFITHDLGIIADMSDDVVVMYLGKILEVGTLEQIFSAPLHPYTHALLDCVPRLSHVPKELLTVIPGVVPDPSARPPGCPFSTRCSRFMPGVCDQHMPALVETEDNHRVACFLHSDRVEDPEG